jgi:hypothetical protein
VEKKDPPAYEERVLQKLNRYFDALLIHSDAALHCVWMKPFSRADDINIPVVYTQGLSASRQIPPMAEACAGVGDFCRAKIYRGQRGRRALRLQAIDIRYRCLRITS